MGKCILRSVGAIVSFGVLLAACGGTKSSPGDASGGGGSGGLAGSGSGGVTACIAGAKRCEGQSIKQCDDAGSTETVVQTCRPGQTCSSGACSGDACVPNTSTCKDGAVWKCDENGVSALVEQCAIGLFCRLDGDAASCSAQACTPNQPVCDGNIATTCRSDGSGMASGGVDCSKSKRACDGGQCRDIVCTEGEKSCQHGDVYLCAHSGTSTSPFAACHSDEVCDAEMGSCRKRLCDPGKVTCDGTRASTCNEFGSAWLPGSVDCATDGKICVSGSCKKQICAANRSFCQDGNVYSCDSSGANATLSQTCNSQTEHCTTYSGSSSAYCKSNDCKAGETVCADNVIKVCNADGSLPASGTACSDTQICENAQCKERPCVPGNYFCKDSNVYYCEFSSPYVSLAQFCDTDTACKVVGTSGASCSPLACSPSSSACVGDKIGTCAADGLSLSAVTTDCTATTSVCTTALKCEKSATDSIGSVETPEIISASTVVGDVIDVDSTRKLTELQTQLVLTGPRDLRWIVYELTGQTFVAKYDKVVAGASGTGFVSSGALNYRLSAGKRYLLAVVISTGDAVDYIDYAPYTKDVSFGTLAGRVVNWYPGTFDVFSMDPSSVSLMKVVTEAP